MLFVINLQLLSITGFHCRPSKPAPRPVVRKNDDYNPSVGRPSAAPSKRPDRDRGGDRDRAGDRGGRKPVSAPSGKPSRDARPADRGRAQSKGDKDKGGAKKEQKVNHLLFHHFCPNFFPFFNDFETKKVQ